MLVEICSHHSIQSNPVFSRKASGTHSIPGNKDNIGGNFFVFAFAFFKLKLFLFNINKTRTFSKCLVREIILKSPYTGIYGQLGNTVHIS